MMKWSKIQAVHNLGVNFRRRRMSKFYALMAPASDAKVLDIGGRVNTWTTESSTSQQFPVTLINLEPAAEPEDKRFQVVEGDATALPFADRSFDIAFSNSVIEHVGGWENQQAFAKEARSVGDKLWIQTPARSFPVEPHLLAPFIHWLPKSVQRRLVRNFTVWGWMVRPNQEHADTFLSWIRLLTLAEFKLLFPDCRILKERVLGMTKSYIAVRT